MRISVSLTNAYEFACHSKACAPPPAGHGGSDAKGLAKGQYMNRDEPYTPSLRGVRARGAPARYTSKGPAVRKGFNKGIAARRAGETSAKNSTTKIPTGPQHGNRGMPGKWKSGTTYDSPKFARTAHTKAKVKKTDPIAKFMGERQKKSLADYWGPGGPPIDKPLFGKKSEVIGSKSDAAAYVLRRIADWKAKED